MAINLHPRNLRIEDYDYPLPDDRIALFPLEQRDSSKLLLVRNGRTGEDIFSNMATHLPPDSLVVFNETRVIHARLLFRRPTGSRIELFCLEPVAPYRDHLRAFGCTGQADWLCLVGNSKRWKHGGLELTAGEGKDQFVLKAETTSRNEDGSSVIRFTWHPEHLTFSHILEQAGKIPLPPYIHRDPVHNDERTYQTIYASREGSVAAPTAGLHFSPEVIASLEAKGIKSQRLVLHVGAGTFRPVSSERLEGHEMHAEQVDLPLLALKDLRGNLDRKITAVGTTTTRLLESLYWHGVKVIMGLSEPSVLDVRQWDPYDLPVPGKISREESLDTVISGCERMGAGSVRGATSLIIAPGYRFRYPDILITNFHQPRSTLLLLISSFIGKNWKEAYRYALENNFRFLSYGDSCLFYKSEPGR